MRTLGLVLLLTACGDGAKSSTPTGSCDMRPGAPVCWEVTGTSDVVAANKSSCTNQGGVWKDAACDRTGSVGGCRSTSDSPPQTYTEWDFPPLTVSGVMQGCAQTYVAP